MERASIIRWLNWSVSGWAALLWLVMLPGVLAAQVQFTPRFDPDDQFQYDVESQTQQTVAVGGVEFKTKVGQTMTILVDVKSAEQAGQVVLTYQPEMMVVSMDVNELTYRFDSRDKTGKEAVLEPIFVEPAKLFDALSKTSWSVTVDDDRQVLAFKGKNDVLEALDESAAAALQDQFDEDYLKLQAQQEFDMLPDEPVRVGQQWRQERELRLEAGQTLRSTVEFTYRGQERRPTGPVHRIDSKTVAASFVFSDMPEASVSPQELTIVESEGQLLFDPRIGDIVASTEKLRVKGKLQVEIEMLELSGTIDLTIETKQKRR